MHNWICLLGRVLLAFIFVMSAVMKILRPGEVEDYMINNGMFFTSFFLWIAVFIELGGGISLLIGYKTKISAILLVAFLIPVTLIFHAQFDKQLQVIMFLKNIAIIGGLLQIVSFGPGAISLDACNKKSSCFINSSVI